MTEREKEIQYLKDVKLVELEQEKNRLRAQGDISDNDRYDSIMMQIMELSNKISKLRQMSDSQYNYQKDWETKLSKNDVFNFFDNDDFVKANINKEFSVEEEIAIIYHSCKTKFEDRVHSLEKRKNLVSKTLATELDAFIKDKYDILNEIKNINNDKIIFAVNDGKNKTHQFFCRTYDVAEGIINKNSQYCNIDIIRITETAQQSPNNCLGGVSFTDKKEIASFSYSGLDKNRKRLNLTTLNSIIVELKHPYEPYDIISVPTWFSYSVVADEKNDNVREFMKANANNTNHYSNCSLPWAKINLPTWYIEDSNYGTVPCGDINLYYGFEYIDCPLSSIKKIDEDDYTDSQFALIDELVRQVNETDNLSKVLTHKK